MFPLLLFLALTLKEIRENSSSCMNWVVKSYLVLFLYFSVFFTVTDFDKLVGMMTIKLTAIISVSYDSTDCNLQGFPSQFPTTLCLQHFSLVATCFSTTVKCCICITIMFQFFHMIFNTPEAGFSSLWWVCWKSCVRIEILFFIPIRHLTAVEKHLGDDE